MEDLKGILFRLLKDEIDSLTVGHNYDLQRISLMREICHLLTYYQYAEVNDSDIIKMMKFYGY